MSLFNELKRRNVFRVGIGYVVFAWLVAQVLELVFDSFGTPVWVMKTVLVLLATGLPFVLFFAWAFEMTPDGIKRESQIDRSQSITQQTGRKLNNAIIGVLVVALGYFVFDKFVLGVSRDAALIETAKQQVTQQAVETTPAPKESEKSIAVLPFVNMSGDQENEYFSDGLTEELLNSLARIRELKVIGRTSSFAFKGKNTDLREIGQTLGVAHILEGSVRKAQNRVRITAQLIKAENGYHMWSDTFDRELDDIFAIQEEIANHVATALTSTLLGDTSGQLVHQGTSDPEAYEAYLRGRYFIARNPDDAELQKQAEQLFKHALKIDPDFTLAWFGQFYVQIFRYRGGSIEYKEGVSQLRAIADKMIAMDPDLPESQIAHGRVSVSERKWSEGEAAYHRALSLNPGDTNALSSIAGLMSILGRNDEALMYAEKAVTRDPLNLQSLVILARTYSYMSRCAEASEVAGRALSLVSDANRVNGLVGDCWLKVGELQKAIEAFNAEPLRFIRLTGLADGYNKLGQQDLAQQTLDELIETEGVNASYQIAQVYAQWGEKDKALDALEQAWSIGDAGFVLMFADDRMNPLRDEPRYKALLEKWREPSTL